MAKADRFTVYAYDLVTGALIAEVPDVGFTFTETLNAAGSFDVTMPIDHPYAGSAIFEPAATQIVFDDGDVIRFAGIVWSTDADPTGQGTFIARGQGILSYYEDGPSGPRRTIQSRAGMTYASTNASGTYPPKSDGTKSNVTGFPDNTTLANNIITFNPPSEIAATANGLTGVVSGCATTPGGGMVVTVAAGVISLAGTLTSFAGSSPTIGASNPLLSRFDLLVVTAAGALQVVVGTAQQFFPPVPSTPAGTVEVAQVFVGAGVGSILAGAITDLRVGPTSTASYMTHFDLSAGGLNNETVESVQVITLAALNPDVAGLTTKTLQFKLNLGGVDYTDGRLYAVDYGVTVYTQTWPTNPATGVAWLASEVEALGAADSAGWITGPLIAGNDVIVYQMKLVVTAATANAQVSFNSIDQFRVVGDLIDHAASIAGPANVSYDAVIFHGPSITIDPRGPLSGVLYTQSYLGSENKGIGQAISEIARRFGGFDYSDSWAWDTSTSPPTPRRYLNLWYPRRGVSPSGAVLELGTNIVTVVHTRDGSMVANPLRGIGAGTGIGTLSAFVLDSSLLRPSSRYPYIEGKYDAHEENLAANLAARTRAHLSLTKLPVDTIRVDVEETDDLKIGDVDVGDAVWTTLIRPSSGWSFVGLCRIVQQSITGTSDGLDKWTFDLALDAVSIGAF